MKPKVGDRVFLTKPGYRPKDSPETQPGHVTKVGRTYFYARGDDFHKSASDPKFELDCANGAPDKNCGQSMYAWRVWESEAAYLASVRRDAMLRALFACSDWAVRLRYRLDSVPTENIAKALELLGIGVDAP